MLKERIKKRMITILTEARKAILFGLAITAGVTILSALYGFIVDGRFVIGYAFTANFVTAAIIIVLGFFTPIAPNRLVNKGKSAQSANYPMHKDYMEARSEKQKKGVKIIWVGIVIAAITGVVEIMVWML